MVVLHQHANQNMVEKKKHGLGIDKRNCSQLMWRTGDQENM